MISKSFLEQFSKFYPVRLSIFDVYLTKDAENRLNCIKMGDYSNFVVLLFITRNKLLNPLCPLLQVLIIFE